MERPAEGEAIAGAEEAWREEFAGPSRFVDAQSAIDDVTRNTICIGDLDHRLAGPRFFSITHSLTNLSLDRLSLPELSSFHAGRLLAVQVITSRLQTFQLLTMHQSKHSLKRFLQLTLNFKDSIILNLRRRSLNPFLLLAQLN